MRHLLVIAYEFPPASSAGVARPLGFVRHLPAHGWRCTVLTVGTGEVADLPLGTRVVRSRCIEPAELFQALSTRPARPAGGAPQAAARPPGGPATERREPGNRRAAEPPQDGVPAGHAPSPRGPRRAQAWLDALAVPDAKVGWLPDGLRRGMEVLGADPVHAVFSTSPRETAHLLGLALSRRAGVPWVADLRDPWGDAFFRAPHAPPARWLDRHLARAVLPRAAAVTVAWPALVDLAVDLGVPRAGCEVILNAWDPSPPFDPAPPGFRLVHAGAFLPRFRDACSLLEAWGRSLATGTADDATLVLVGCDPATAAEVRARGLDRVEVRPRVSRTEALRAAAHATVLYVSNCFGPCRGTPTSAFLPGKVFDGLGTGRPMVVQAQPGSPTAELLSALPGHVVLPDRDPAALAEALLMLHARWRTVGLPDLPLPTEHARPARAAQLAGVLDRVV